MLYASVVNNNDMTDKLCRDLQINGFTQEGGLIVHPSLTIVELILWWQRYMSMDDTNIITVKFISYQFEGEL